MKLFKGAVLSELKVAFLVLWTFPQFVLGLFCWLYCNYFKKNKIIDTFEYKSSLNYFMISNSDRRISGMCMGMHIFMSYIPGYEYDINLWRHEYGHHVQSNRWGPLYLLLFGFPSFGSMCVEKIFGKSVWDHDEFWVEKNADKLGEKYFRGDYGKV